MNSKYIYNILFFLSIVLTSCRPEIDTEVTADFIYEVVGDQYQVPVQIKFTNTTRGADRYQWTFEGANPNSYDKREPGTIVFFQPGSIKVTLEAWNNEQRKTKEVIILLDTPLRAQFNPEVIQHDISPADYNFNNSSTGASRFNWTFEGGTPATSAERNPRNIRFTTPGVHKVFMEVLNERNRKDTLTKFITVRPPLSADFAITPSFDDEDYQAPLVATLDNHSISALTHRWSATGGVISNAADSVPTITFANPGTYTVTYKASNGKDSATIVKSITVLPNTFMRTFTDVRLGINTAHATIGSFFSTRLRRVFKEGEVNTSNGDKIDLVFFGLNGSFTFNEFISPDSAQLRTFAAIPGATFTGRINSQELCNCNTPAYSSTDFDNLTNGNMLSSINVLPNYQGLQPFTNALTPRLVLFRNAAGKKGVIKIKQFISNGQQSYIICDIKVQKD